jgi:hypothetical protein
MKTTIRSALAGCAFALVTAAVHFSGLLPFENPVTIALVGGLVVGGLTAFALSDYKRKPSFRVRPPAESGSSTVETDWTYATRVGHWGQPTRRAQEAADHAAPAAPASSGPASEIKAVRQ